MRAAYRYASKFVVAAFVILSSWYLWGQRAGVSPSDCVGVKYICGLWMSWNGTQVAYLVQSPNIDQNRNDYQLYIREIEDKGLSPGKLLISGAEISDVRWLRDDGHIAMLIPIAGVKKLVFVNVSTGIIDSTVETSSNIEYYGIDSTGSTLVYSAANSMKRETDLPGPTSDEIASGYRIRFGEKQKDGWPISSIYIRRRETNGNWSAPRALTIENPFTHVKATRLSVVQSLSLSPDGKRLLFSYLSDAIPEEWKKDPVVQGQPGTANSLFVIMVLYDVDKQTTALAFNSLSPASVPLWASDSGSFLVNASSPIGSNWEQEDIRDHRASPADGNLFAVYVDSDRVEEVVRNVPDHHEAPLFWQKGGDVIVRSASTTISKFRRINDSWREAGQLKIATNDKDRFLYLTSNGTDIVGTHETVSTPRDLFVNEPGQSHIRLLTDLNAQLREVQFAPVETVHWSTAGGLNVSGLLFMPPDHVPGTRYPLVIETKGDDGEFTCDSGFNDDPSFAPQPLATSGIMYLVRTRNEDWKYQEEIDERPRGYPGGIGEAVQQMDIWDSAVAALDKRGLIDPTRVGIIGFSRTGWQVEFDLFHSHIRYAAATAADNVQYSLSDYWLIPWISADVERMYGGPPYGETLENWQKYSISFNLDKIHTPLLMEIMGYGTRDDDQNLFPANLAVRYEISRGLMRLGKPVEMYFYPNEGHQPDHPKARIASVERNVDWYRFWLQGYEDVDPSKKDQYARWRALKVLHEQDLKRENGTPILDR
jgi:dipeptidyl aminopeptidase/acylaminoacyl peptidase